tara:strand:+ start:262 stop:447 length:186 start_codon:yes stop_codon:yes gene_type:complete
MKILGYILIMVAVVDFCGSWVGFDFWLEVFGINLTGILYQFSAFIVGGIGYSLVQAGSQET